MKFAIYRVRKRYCQRTPSEVITVELSFDVVLNARNRCKPLSIILIAGFDINIYGDTLCRASDYINLAERYTSRYAAACTSPLNEYFCVD